MRNFLKISLLVLLISARPLCAQTALNAFSESIKTKFVSFEYTFKVNGNVPLMGSGEVCFQNSSFRMSGNGLLICSDGKNRWTVDQEEKEVYIESVSSSDVNYVSNPALLLAEVETAFVQKSVSNVNFAGKNVKAVRLAPAVSGTGLTSMILYLDGTVPVGADITVQDGAVTAFKFTGYEIRTARPSGISFFFDESALDKSYVVTDLR